MAASSGRTVLVVEDDFSSLKVIALLLEGEGLAVLTASDGQEAWERLAADPRVDLVITDYVMPRVNGIELCRRMAADEVLRAIPVIFMSATWNQFDHLGPQVMAVFGKPLLFENLIAKVHEILGI